MMIYSTQESFFNTFEFSWVYGRGHLLSSTRASKNYTIIAPIEAAQFLSYIGDFLRVTSIAVLGFSGA